MYRTDDKSWVLFDRKQIIYLIQNQITASDGEVVKRILTGEEELIG